MTWEALTRWGRDVDPAHPWPEHPRPQLARDGWRSLNGPWEYAVRPAADGTPPSQYDASIVVPFSPETVLSGVGRQLQPDEDAFYRRIAELPALPPGGRMLLHFGAVDQTCTVWVDGVQAGSHTGGYLPFTLDITDLCRDTGPPTTALIEVRVRDPSETGVGARGKQRLDRGRIWYTAQSGIWQTVWVEAVPAGYVERLEVAPPLDEHALKVTVHAAAETAQVTLRAEGVVVCQAAVRPGVAHLLDVPDPRPWSPEDPFLYNMEVTTANDRVTSYAAMRSIETRPDDRGVSRLLLNGTPYQHVGVLDQGYWPDGLLTPPSDAAMVHDIATMKDLGFTMLRKHVKVEPLRWYYHCDRLGMLVWQDMVNGGGRYRHLTTTLPATRPVRIPDRLHRLFFRGDRTGRDGFRDEVRRTVALLSGSPSVVVWTVFNEGWGQFDANAIVEELHRLDPTRPVVGTSGWVDQGAGDIRAHHSYVRPWTHPRPDRRGRVLALTEYGGYSLRVAGHDWSDREFGYRHLDDADALADAFEELHRNRIAPSIAQGLAATVYTQLSDVEDELNGLLTWDREVLKIPADRVRAVLTALRGVSSPPTRRRG